MKPKVSIIFTSYNHKHFLKQAIDSLLSQTFKDFELIIVDDCSTDGSQDILKSFNDPRIRLYLNKKNSGSYVTSSNYGASIASAPYIIFSQCDDWAEPIQLEKLVGIMDNHDVGVVFSSSNLVDEKGRFISNDFYCREKSFKKKCYVNAYIRKDEMSRFLTMACVIPNLSAALIRRDLYEKEGGLSSDFLVLADWDFWLRMTNHCDFYYIREPLNNFRQHKTTIRNTIKLERQLKELFDMLFLYRNNTSKNNY